MLVSKNSLLNILLPNDNKILKDVLKEADSKNLESTTKDKSTSTSNILKNLFNDLKNGNKTSFSIENILKGSNIEKELGSFAKNFDTLLSLLKASPNLSNISTSFENMFKDMKNLNANILQEQLNKSGIHLESKLSKVAKLPKDSLLNNPKLDINNDMKTLLLKAQEQLVQKADPASSETLKQIDKMLTQIDFHQLTSLASNSNYVYVPFFWEMLEEGTIDIKESEDEKFYCQINLNLKNLGKVDLMLAIYDENKIDITMKAQKEEFRNLVQENIQELKKSLNSVDLMVSNIKLLDFPKDEDLEESPKSFQNNYNQDITSHIDIRV
jgi:hypothetical protein